MKMFSDCSGECIKCRVSYIGGCLAGHGDDDFSPIGREEAIKLLNMGTDYRHNKLSKEEKNALERIASFGMSSCDRERCCLCIKDGTCDEVRAYGFVLADKNELRRRLYKDEHYSDWEVKNKIRAALGLKEEPKPVPMTHCFMCGGLKQIILRPDEQIFTGHEHDGEKVITCPVCNGTGQQTIEQFEATRKQVIEGVGTVRILI